VWDAATGAEIIAVSTPEASVATAQFSPDGRRILTASYDGAARIWDAASGQEVAALDSGTQAVSSAAYVPDGQRVVLTCLDGSIQIWPAFPTLRALIDHARSIMPRELTREQRARFFLDLGGLPRPQ
jgi:WD40 repeat protein